MATIKTTFALQDKMSSGLRNIAKSVGNVEKGLKAAKTAGDNAFNASAASRARVGIEKIKTSLSDVIRKYKDAENGQNGLNNRIQQGTNLAGGLLGKIKGIAAGYAGMQGVKMLAKMSDELAQTQARINLMNDGAQTTEELMRSIYKASERSRGSYQDMADVVAKIGNNARNAFKSSEEIVKFSELIQKQFKISGATTQEASNAMVQLTQALASGVLRGQDFKSVLSQAPMLIDLIAKKLGAGKDKIRELAEEGKLTADVVRGAVLDAEKDINKMFKSIPMTWGDVWTQAKNKAITALQPVLYEINQLANNDNVKKMVDGIEGAVSFAAKAVGGLLRGVANVYNFFADNWSKIAPIIGTVTAAIITVKGVQEGYNAVLAATAFLQGVINSGMLLIVAAVAALIGGFVALCVHLGKTNSKAKSTFSQFVAGIYVVGEWFKNLGVVVKATFSGIWAVVEAVFHNIGVDAYNMTRDVKYYFNDLLHHVMNVVGTITEMLNFVPFIDIDTSGIWAAADKFKSKAADALYEKKDYVDYGAAFSAAYNAAGGNSAFADGWKTDAAKKGKKAAEEVAKSFSFSKIGDSGPATGYLDGIQKASGDTADNTGSIAKSLAQTNEELAWLRDIAERDAINRFTTAEIKIDMTGMTNRIDSDVDLDGMFNKFVNDVKGALRTAAAGVS